ncbi:MAG: PAS domain-containing protein [Bacteroidota bacterium]
MSICKKRTITFANPAANILAGLKTGDLLSKLESLLVFVNAEDQEYVRNEYSTIENHPKVTNIEFRLRSAGNTLWLHCKAYLFDNNRLAFVVASDITRTRQNEDYLAEFAAKKNTVLDTVHTS